ncbi:hypothetical protein MGN70_000386 [Eutypa lata]|nr:hypothetical protein MGN70_000386 [Eutypa lata]
MKIIQAFSVAACGFPTLAFATPAPAEAMGKDLIASGVIAKPELNARTIIGLFRNDPRYEGSAIFLEVETLSTCYNLPQEFIDQASSYLDLQTTPGRYACDFYDNTDCNSDEPVLTHVTYDIEDFRNIPVAGGTWDDRVASYMCYEG